MKDPGGVEAAIGYACTHGATGTAYARLSGPQNDSVMRIPFACRPLPALRERDVAYAALDAVAATLLENGVRRATFVVADAELVADLQGRRRVPQPLALPYVRLRCRLNRFITANVVAAENDPRCRDLEGRARAEVSLDIAA